MINELDALLEMHKEPVAGDALDGQVHLEHHEGLDEFNKSEVVIDSELGGDDDAQPQDTFHEMEDDQNFDDDQLESPEHVVVDSNEQETPGDAENEDEEDDVIDIDDPEDLAAKGLKRITIEGEDEEFLLDLEGNIFNLKGEFVGTADGDVEESAPQEEVEDL